MIRAAHRKEQMKSFAPEIDIELVRRHRPGHHGVGDEEHVLIRGALEGDPVELPHRAARSVAPRNPAHRRFAHTAVGVL
jgi:hypothetical protein